MFHLRATATLMLSFAPATAMDRGLLADALKRFFRTALASLVVIVFPAGLWLGWVVA